MRSSKKMTKRFRNVKKATSKRRTHKGGDDTTKSYTEIDENPEMNKMVKGIIGAAEDEILQPERPFPKEQQNLFPSDYFSKMPKIKKPTEGTYDEMVKSHANEKDIQASSKPLPTGISVTEHPYYDENVVRQEASEQEQQDNYGGIEFGGKRKTKRRGHHKKPKKRYTKKHNKKQHKKYHKK